MKNYTEITKKYIEDIQSNVTVYKHNKTNARICTIENDDTNKVFSIAFRTPPINNGGLTHILEHSVLCGSKKYPVKDPFVELLKSSLNTFLNAFTFPDKTMYPCASQNDTDFKNLMSVYMDAVFYPQIYEHKEIFMQEGWHYHLLDEKDPITYNGVVYNEMKGAFSDPQQILFRNILHSLYPDTAYGFESGGDPKYIPDLSYEDFLNFHSKFYHPSNSYIFLYGDCDMEERLSWLDKEYLSHFGAIDFDTTIKEQKPFAKPVHETDYYPLEKEKSLEHKTFLSYNVVFPSTLDAKLMLASSILVDAILNNPGAPLKKALIDAKLGDDVEASFEDGLLQPLLGIIVVNSDESKEKKFIEVVDHTLKELVQNGLNHEDLKSLINFQEFKVREGKYDSYPKGLDVELTCMSSWLYSEDLPFSKLENLKYFDELRKDLEEGYFEKIIEDYILNNHHKTYVKLVPSHTIGEEREKALVKRLEDYKTSLSKAEIKKLIEETKNLKEYQSIPSTLEELATLPKLELKDIKPEPEKLHCEAIKDKYPILFSDYHTNEIDYVGYSFDLTGIDIKTAQYAQLLSDLFANISTKSYSYAEINQRIQNDTGGIQFKLTPYKTMDRKCKVSFEISFSALERNIDKANEIVLDILNHTDFKETSRLYERISELNVAMEMNIANRGHVVSYVRAGSYADEMMAFTDATAGIGYLDFIHHIYSNFEKEKNQFIKKLEDLIESIFIKKNFMLKFTGSKEGYQKFKKIADQVYQELQDNKVEYRYSFKPEALNEGLKTQYDVNFVSRVGFYKEQYNGAMTVLNNALSLDYLWQKVRVHGGAYGCMLQTTQTGTIGIMSYRDPEIEKTNKVYEEIVSYIENFNPSEEDLVKFKIGAIGKMESVLHVSSKGAKAQTNYLLGNTYDMQVKYRKEALEATKEDIISLAPLFKEILDQNLICVIGNARKIDHNKKLFENIRNLVKE